MERFVESLRQQLYFLGQSCAQFDSGEVAEAIRMAGVLRVLLVKTRNMTPLYEHLLIDSESMFLQSYMDPYMGEPDENVLFFDRGTMLVNGANGSGFRPLLGSGPPIIKVIPFSEWWGQKIWISSGHSFSREELVRTMADKDGANHIDSTLPEGYLNLIEGGEWAINDGNGRMIGCNNIHFILVRQIAWEAMQCEALTKYQP